VTQSCYRRLCAAAALLAGSFALADRAGAQTPDPVAIVEDIAGTGAAVHFMDYVTAGTVIKLGAADTLVLGYMRSCWRESIKGGTVTVGEEQSAVADGEVKRQKVECDGGRMRLSAAQAGQSGAMVFRGAVRPGTANVQVQLTLYGRSPFIDIKGGGRVVIERLDVAGERHELDVKLAGRDAFYDFAKNGRTLTAGGTYRAKTVSGEIVFKVDPKARTGPGPIVGRLLKL
jgi:hypothetical protein